MPTGLEVATHRNIQRIADAAERIASALEKPHRRDPKIAAAIDEGRRLVNRGDPDEDPQAVEDALTRLIGAL